MCTIADQMAVETAFRQRRYLRSRCISKNLYFEVDRRLADDITGVCPCSDGRRGVRSVPRLRQGVQRPLGGGHEHRQEGQIDRDR